LDVYGTMHDPRSWADPEAFDPTRFLTGSFDPDTLIPQGGGDVATGHRCPGESVVLAMLTVAIRALSRVPHAQPHQDSSYDLTEMPTRPSSGTILTVTDEATATLSDTGRTPPPTTCRAPPLLP